MIEMQTHRFFIGDLPAGTSETQIRKVFKDHGEVTNVELKEKENLVEPGSVKALAFVTLKLYDGDVNYCLKKLNSKQINGQYIRVSVARESFMERLKREREETAQLGTKSEKHTPAEENKVQPSKKSKKFSENDEEQVENPFKLQKNDFQTTSKSKKVFDSDSDEEAKVSDDDGDPILITKKRASASMRNGRIVIEGTKNAPIHVIGKQKEVKPQMDEKSFNADKKRKESVKKKKNQYQLQKSLIQKSLSSVDASKTKKIVFDYGSDNEYGVPTKALFDDGSDQEGESHGNEFALKAEYEGARGAELMKLQSKMSLDPRFKVDHKFVDHIEEGPARKENNERDWQYGILEQVTGNKVSSLAHPRAHEKKMLKMVRYDPSKDNQEGLLRKSKKTLEREKNVEDEVEEVADKHEVSKEVFYVVSDNLTNSLKTRGDGFSLLSIFGTATEEESKSSKMDSNEKILISKSEKNLNPFTYDSSESENEEEPSTEKVAEKKAKASKGSGKDAPKIFVESFFIPQNDIRLKEGKAFFKYKPSEKVQNYDEIRNKLKNIIKTKIKKTKRQFKGKITKRTIRRK